MIAIVVHLELSLMFRFKILIKSKSEITGLKNKYCCVPPFIHFLIDRGRNVHTSVFTEMNIFRLNTKLKIKKKLRWFFFFFSFFTLNGTHPSPEISFLFFPPWISFRIGRIPVVLHKRGPSSFSIQSGSRAEICCPVLMPIMTKYCEDKHWHPIIT